MIKIGILGAIGSGKSYVARNFGYPVFNADEEVAKLYNTDRKLYSKLKSLLPGYFYSFPIEKRKVLEAILANKANLKKIIKLVHKEIKKKLRLFIKKNANKKMVILDIPLLLENKLNNKKDILIFVQAKKYDIYKRLNKRKNFNTKLYEKFKKIQLSVTYKKKKSTYVIKNDFKKRTVLIKIKKILNEIK